MRELAGFWLAVLVLLGVVAMGCEPTNTQPPSVKGGTWDVTEVELSDGVRCAVYDGFKSGGISCDWEANRVQPIHIELSPGEYDNEEVHEFLKRVEAASKIGETVVEGVPGRTTIRGDYPMSASDQTRRDYLWSTMSVAERCDVLKARLDRLEAPDPMKADVWWTERGYERKPEADNPGRTYFVGDDCEGGHQKYGPLAIARWMNIESAVIDFLVAIKHHEDLQPPIDELRWLVEPNL